MKEISDLTMTIKANTQISIDRETAELCLKIAGMYANQNRLIIACRKHLESSLDAVTNIWFFNSAEAKYE